MEIGGGSLWHHRRNILICSCVCLSTFQYGFDYGLTSGLQAMPGFLAVFGYKDPTLPSGYGIDSTVQQLINSLMTAGAFLGSLAVGPLGKFVGRRWALWGACILNHRWKVGAILMVSSTEFAALYASRVIIGLANGLFMVETQLYIQESAVPSYRGFLMGIYQVCLALGSIIGSIVDNYTADQLGKSSYQIPCGCLFIVPTFLLFALPFLPETPRWLIEQGRNTEARTALVRLRATSTDHHVIDAELNEMVEATQMEHENDKGSLMLFDMVKGINRRRSALSVCLVVSLSATGNLFFIIYGTYFFALAGTSEPFAETIGMNCAGLAGVLLSLYLITYLGRRTILLMGAAVQGLCMMSIGAVTSSGATSRAASRCMVAFVVIHMFFYTMCTAPYLYLVSGEIPSNRLRSLTLGIASSFGFVAAWIISFTIPYFLNPQELNWGAKYAWIWFGSNVAYFLFMFFYLPETKDRTLEEIDEMFEEKVPAWKFKGYTSEEKPVVEVAESIEMSDSQHRA
ncbi:MFS monosaccharide transporter-like protein [Phialemonium atrogriseum]|uniref:MFS monosaccharide transporter-like protein n=1 Tax=Phialemonium atrogriseum TaxID=1093897 RepID=A0AAJ0FJJ9_9PEZI|nr:MFS monosaccharide transporter-like protein [Phialemonium atrogriseum]KAK1764519.1 MFS monosaccharide transporter-like protein [Phialemonium atrogriseum]